MALIGHNVYPKKKAKRLPKGRAYKCGWCDTVTRNVWRIIPPDHFPRKYHYIVTYYRNKKYSSLKCIGDDLSILRQYNRNGWPTDLTDLTDKK